MLKPETIVHEACMAGLYWPLTSSLQTSLNGLYTEAAHQAWPSYYLLSNWQTRNIPTLFLSKFRTFSIHT